MFYSYDILTDRKHGIATIWLMATLGSTATLKKKIQTRNILSVNLPKAIETLLLPEAPLALRLQSNLLYGVSRVYLHQCNYTLKQAQNAHEQMLKMLAITRGSNIDSDKSQIARKDQLVLQDDPSFMPELEIPSLDAFFPDIHMLHDYHSLHSSSASRSFSSNRSVPGIMVPSSDSGPEQLGGRSQSSFSDMDNQQVRTLARGASQTSLRANNMFLEDPLFTIDADGNMHDIAEVTPYQYNSVHELHGDQDDNGELGGVATAVGYVEEAPPLMLDDDNAGFAASHEDGAGLGSQVTDSQRFVRAQQSPAEDQDGIEYAAAAAKRQTRAPRLQALDQRIQLTPDELRSFNQNYAEHMQQAIEAKFKYQAPIIAKKNAHYWVWGRGIGAIGKDYSSVNVNHPFNMFLGDALYERIMGVSVHSHEQSLLTSAAKRKRAQDDVDLGRQVRSRVSSTNPELDHPTDLMDLDSGGMGIVEDEPEIGRKAPTPLAADHQSDISSSMPWNRSGSFRQTGSMTSMFRGLPFHTRGRMSSASPLVQRGSQPRERAGSMVFDDQFEVSNSSLLGNDDDDDDDLELLLNPGYTANKSSRVDEEHDGVPGPDEVERFGAAAYVDTQTAGGSQWALKALDQESGNFLEYFRNAISMKKAAESANDAQEEEAYGRPQTSITFEELLPSNSNTKIVAAQGLLHALSLATKNVLHLEQGNDFDDIAIRLVHED